MQQNTKGHQNSDKAQHNTSHRIYHHSSYFVRMYFFSPKQFDFKLQLHISV